jgi:hypothetical protein
VLRHGSLFPFALKASPNGVSLPPPALLSWHSPQAFPVCVANAGVAFAGREMIKDVVPANKITAAAQSIAFDVMVASPLSLVDGPLSGSRP